ncbi:MAG: hypothetical protein Q8922_15045 [Bacteroidota bacterium]|nr:hypothetical protein [Bacteroidota bacterium]MDP4234143.1 hypothetical protein [Bacteroidota bacterium]MDP4244080.1 hypothetical protein [Bacteroidota bacterium]MDP4289234.1 hypothetical protein [Bacteroidota bacterium]
MAGIFGIRSSNHVRDLHEDSSKLLHAAQQGFNHPHTIHFFEDSAIGCATPHHYSQTKWPILSSDRRYALAVFGEIYLPDGSPLRSENFEVGFLRPFLKSKQEFLRKLDGAFVFALMNEDECTIANDPFGNFALHYALLPDGFVFASQMEGLRSLLANRVLDKTGIQQYLGLGVTLGGRTTFEGITRLAGGSYLVISRNGIERCRYFKPTYREEPSDATNTNLATIEEALQTAVKKRTAYSKVVAGFTGGFDSRATWSIILNQKRQVAAHTHGLPDCTDLQLANRITTELGIPLDRIPFDREFLRAVPDRWNEIVRLTEGGISIAHAPTIQVWHELGSRYSVEIDSYGGAFYRRQRMKVAERLIDAKKDLILELLRFEQSPLLSSSLLKPDARHAVHESAMDALREYYDSIADTMLLGDKLDRFHFEQVDAMKDSLGGNAQMNFIGLAHPFLNLTAIEAVGKIPLALRRRDAIHKHIVHSQYPCLEDFPVDSSGFVLPYRGFTTLRYAPIISERALQTAARLLPSVFGNLSLRRPTMDTEHMLRPGLSKLRERLLAPHPEYDTYVDRRAVETMIDRFNVGSDVGSPLVQLLTFRLFLDLFG